MLLFCLLLIFADCCLLAVDYADVNVVVVLVTLIVVVVAAVA